MPVYTENTHLELWLEKRMRGCGRKAIEKDQVKGLEYPYDGRNRVKKNNITTIHAHSIKSKLNFKGAKRDIKILLEVKIYKKFKCAQFLVNFWKQLFLIKLNSLKCSHGVAG